MPSPTYPIGYNTEAIDYPPTQPSTALNTPTAYLDGGHVHAIPSAPFLPVPGPSTANASHQSDRSILSAPRVAYVDHSAQRQQPPSSISTGFPATAHLPLHLPSGLPATVHVPCYFPARDQSPPLEYLDAMPRDFMAVSARTIEDCELMYPDDDDMNIDREEDE